MLESTIMPVYTPTTIAYQETGLIKDRQAFVTPNDAYVQLDNAYVWRGITKRRKGYETLGRLRRVLLAQALTATVASATYDNGAADILTTLGLRATEPDAEISCGSLIITFDSGGGSETILNDSGDGTLATTATNALNATGGTLNYVTGMISVTFAAPIGAGLAVIVDFNYFPCLPAMGISQIEIAEISAEDTIFFDTKYAYKFVTSAFVEFVAGTTWTGDNTNFFWGTNYWSSGTSKLFWATNFNGGNSGDPIRYTNGAAWFTFAPDLDVTAPNPTVLQQALMLIPYRGRLMALNTWEGIPGSITQKPNRARWSQIGDPTQAGGWRSDIQGKGNLLDAPTNEEIIGAGFIRDTLIVFFEQSTWKLRYTGNDIGPFVWERINIELGAESTFSTVIFDKGILAVGDKAIVTCDGNYVERIDESIRDEVFEIHNGNDGVKRVHGIRNFFEQVVYWVFPSQDQNPIYPNRVLVYNYDNKTWAFFRDTFTVLGEFQKSNDTRWSDLVGTNWQQRASAWNAGRNQSQFPFIVGGNQQGYIQIFNQKVSNDASLHIKAVATGTPPTITSTDHNLEEDEIIEINSIVGTTSTLNGFRYRVSDVTQNTFQIQQKPRFDITAIDLTTNTVTATGNNLVVGDLVQFAGILGTTELNGKTGTVLTRGTPAGNDFSVDIDMSGMTAWTSVGTAENCNGVFNNVVIAGGATYLGCGEIRKVSNFSIRSKKFNMINKGRKTQLGHLDFLVDVTDTGQVSVPIYVDYNNSERVNKRGGDPFFNWGINTKPQDFSTANQEKEWHRMYCNSDSQFFQYEITLDEPQMISKEIQESGFTMDAIIVWHEVGARLV